MTLDCGGGTDASGVHDVGGADAIGGTRSGYHGRLPGGKNENYRHRLKREFEDLINSQSVPACQREFGNSIRYWCVFQLEFEYTIRYRCFMPT